MARGLRNNLISEIDSTLLKTWGFGYARQSKAQPPCANPSTPFQNREEGARHAINAAQILSQCLFSSPWKSLCTGAAPRHFFLFFFFSISILRRAACLFPFASSALFSSSFSPWQCVCRANPPIYLAGGGGGGGGGAGGVLQPPTNKHANKCASVKSREKKNVQI